MYDLEKQLKKLPRVKLRFGANMKIQLKLRVLLWQRKFAQLSNILPIQKIRLVPVIVVIILCLFIILPSYAYASSSVTRGHILYPVKQAIEKVEINFSRSATAKVKTYEKLASRRLAEAEVLSQPEIEEEVNVALVETVNEAVRLGSKAQETVKQIPSAVEAEEVQSVIVAAQDKQERALVRIAEQVGIDASETVLDSVALAFQMTTKSLQETKKWPAISSSAADKVLADEEATSTEEGMVQKPAKSSVLSKPSTPSFSKASSTESARQSFNQLKQDISVLKEDLTDNEFKPKDIQTLYNRLEEKVKKVEDAINNDKFDDAQGLMRTTKALTNNAKHFMKQQNNTEKKDRNEFKFYQTEDDQPVLEEDEDEDEDEEQEDNQDQNKHHWIKDDQPMPEEDEDEDFSADSVQDEDTLTSSAQDEDEDNDNQGQNRGFFKNSDRNKNGQ